MASKFYDLNRLLQKKDINNNKPEIYGICGTRSAGKTTSVTKYVIDNFLKKKQKFMFMYRFNYELDDCAEKIFKDVKNIFYEDLEFSSKKRMQNIYHELFINNESCGYAIAINGADMIKKNSHLFSDTSVMVFDEFQSETNHYCSNEIKKFMSIHTSVARGKGEQVRFVPVFMMSNNVSLLNPYFTALGISSRLQENTKFLRGEGFVFEFTSNESARQSQLKSQFNKAFSTQEYVNYSANNKYLNDKTAFIEKVQGKNNYFCTIKVYDKEFAIREFTELGIMYCDSSVDKTYRIKICATTDEHEINFIMLRRNSDLLNTLRYYFEHGCFRFKDLECKNAILKLLTYSSI